MAGPGRNDPCPCGSGKKFKHCCLTRPQAATGITPRDRTEAFDALLEYSRREQFDSLVASSAREWADMPNAPAGEALAFIIEFPTSAETFFDWLFFDVRTDDGRTIADAFLGARQWTVSPAAAEYMRLMRESHLRLYQVRDVRPGAGLTLRDLWTKDDLFIKCEGSIMALPPHAAKPA